MKEYTMTRCNGQPDWSKIPALQINELHNTPPVDITAQAQVCYDDEALYIRLSTVEKNIRAELTGLLDEVCEDSCLEFFFSPVPGDIRYFNIEVNPNGAMYHGFGDCVANLMRLIPDAENPIQPRITRTEDGWNVCYDIPHRFVRMFFPEFDPKAGGHMHGNFFKCGGKTDPKHFMCWCPVVPRPCAFHNQDAFGTLYFG